MNLINRLNGIQMVNPRVQPDLIHNHYSRLLHLLIKRSHSGGDVAGGDDMSLAFDGRLDHSCVVCVRD